MNTKFLFLAFLVSAFSWGQVDDFSDGNFTANPVWSGDTGSFSVFTDATLPSGSASTDGFFLGSNSSSGNATLTTPSTEVSEWRFSWGSGNWDPSLTNYFGVVLMSSHPGAISTSGWTGYFLKIGASGDSDKIELWKKNGGSGAGTKVGDFSSSPSVGTGQLQNGLNIRITRSSSGVFTLYYATGFTYSSTPTTSAGTLTDNAISTSAYFGITQTFANPSATRRNYIDNIVLGANPTITVGAAVTGLDYAQGSGPSVGKPFTVSGTNLTANISLAAPTNFEFSTSLGGAYSDALTVNQSGGTVVTTTLYVRLKAGLTANSYSGNVTASSTGATNKTIAVSGTVTAPAMYIEADPNVVAFGDVPTGTASTPQIAAVLAEYLTGNIAVNSEHSGFQISTDGTNWVTQLTLVKSAANDYLGDLYIRYNATTTGAQSGKITFKVGGTTYEEINFSGTGVCSVLPVTPENSFSTSNNPSCGPATLSYTGSVPAVETYYWQTSATGVSIATPISSNQTISTTGSRFVRARNNTSQCWSVAMESPVVTINTAIAITTHPTNKSIIAGATTTFTVVATGTATITYQWQENTGSGWLDIPNATTATYTTPTAAVEMSGYQYQVKVTNSCGTVTSNAATLTVLQPTIVLASTFSLFSYAEGQGPSAHQTFTVSGTNLAANITLTAPTNWEISTTATFTTPLQTITLTKNGSNAVSSTSIHIRLKSGLLQNTYTGTLEASSTNAITKTATVNGEVTNAVAFINVEANLGSFPDITNGSNTPIATQNTLFGARAIATSEAKSFRIQNLGGSVLNLSGLTLTGSNPEDFSISTPPPATVAAGATVTFEVTFSPTAGGERTAIVNIPNNSANASTFTFNIRGTGNNAEINITGNAVAIANGSTSISSTNNTLMGNANANVANPSTISKPFVISNSGNITLSVSSITVSDAVNFTVSPATATITAGSTATFTVTFNPTTTGIKNATITIANNDVTDSENPYTFAIQGNASTYTVCALGGLGPLQTIAVQDFETPAATPTWAYTNSGGTITGGTAYAVVSGSNATVNKFIGTKSYQVSNTTGSLNFNFNTLNYQEIELSLRIGSFSGTTGNGADAADNVKVLVSTNGTTFIEDVLVKGNSSNMRWGFGATGTANTAYDGSSNEFGSDTGDTGISTLTLTNLPSVSTLYIRITAVNNDANEVWAIDNITLKGKTLSGVDEKTWNGTAWSGDENPPTASQKAIFSGNYDTSVNGNITACECQVNTGVTLTVAPKTVPTYEDRYLSVESDIVNNGIIEILNNNSLYQANDGADNTGSGIMKLHRISQPMYRYDFTYWSSPLTTGSGFTLGNHPTLSLSPGTLADKFYKWKHDGTPQSWEVIYSGAEVMVPGRGYIVRAPQSFSVEPSVVENYTATFTGVPNNGVVEHAVTGGTDKWNLIGNPYPSAIDIEKFLFQNRTLLEGTAYLWTHNSPLSQNQYTAHDYATYNFTGPVATKPSNSPGSNTNTPTRFVGSGQAFFVKGISSGNVVFNNAMRDKANNTTFFRPSPTMPVENWDMTGKHRIWLNITNDQGAFNQTLVGYLENATNGVDWGYDGGRFSGNFVALYSILDNKEYTIQGRGLPFSNQDTVPMGYTTTLTGTVKIGIDHFDGLFEGQDIFLEDLLLNVTHDLKASDYSFSTVPGTFNSRFILKYINTTLGNENPETVANAVLVYNGNKGSINIKSELDTLKEITVYDLLGRVVYENNTLSQNEFTVSNVVMNDQVLIVKVKLENGVIVSKKIVY